MADLNHLTALVLFGDNEGHCHEFKEGIDSHFYYCACGIVIRDVDYAVIRQNCTEYWQRFEQRLHRELGVA